MRTLGLITFCSICLFINCEENGKQFCVESCKEEEQSQRLGEHCFIWSTTAATWEDAKLFCESLNGSLAAVTSMEIHNFLMKKVDKDDEYTWYWIGGSDKEREGTWKWEDGSVWDFTNWASRPKKQPSGGDNSDCLQIYHSSANNGWNDNRCRYHYSFICSWRICSAHTTTDVSVSTTTLNNTDEGKDSEAGITLSPQLGTAIAFGVLFAGIVLGFCLLKVFQKLKTTKREWDAVRAPKEDINHYYGDYYRSDSTKIDESTMEFKDTNDYYG